MTPNTNIIVHWHEKLLASTRKQYQDIQTQYANKIKPHSAITVMAGFATVGPFSLLRGIAYDNLYGQTFLIVLKTSMAILCVALYVAAFYHWRVFFELRRQGISTDKNFFFAESAGLNRKIFFYIALLIDSVRSIQTYIHYEDVGQRMRRLKYQLRSDYYHNTGIAILESTVLAVLFIELMRIIFPGTFNWSDKKHLWVVVLISTSIFTLRILSLNLSSGHGVF